MSPALVHLIVNWMQSRVTWEVSFSEELSRPEWPVRMSAGLS